MAVTAKIYAPFFENMGGGDTAGEGPMDLLSDTIKIMLTTASHTISQAHGVKASITNEVSGTGYTATGNTLGSKTYSTTSLTSTFDAADTVWTTSTITAAQAHLYDDTPTSPADPLMSYIDFGGSNSSSGADFTIVFNASGIWSVTVA